MVIYKVQGDTHEFRSLRNAKHYISSCYTKEERLKTLNGSRIEKYVNGVISTITPIFVTEDGYSFGKTFKY